MRPIAVALNRFLRLLPFLTTPGSYRRFQHEYFVPFPDVWADPVFPPHPDAPQAAEPAHPERQQAHPDLAPASLQHADAGRQEPFW